jgi:plasmid stabilization system protein ParE
VKRYEVIILPAAEADLRAAFSYIHERSPINAGAWLRGFLLAIDALEYMPQRCSPARECVDLGADVRQHIYQSYRVLFTIEKNIVYVHHIRHAARDTLADVPGIERPRTRSRRRSKRT